MGGVHFEELAPVLRLRKLEYKYDFFRFRTPILTKHVESDDFNFFTRFGTNLIAKNFKGGHLEVGLSSGHAFLEMFPFDGELYMRAEGQEKMLCDPEIGYSAIRDYFKKNGTVVGNNYMINVDGDYLKFDDKDSKHKAFWGWTGGYAYDGLMSGDDIGSLLSWVTNNEFEALEKRLVSLEKLFDGICESGGFKPAWEKEERCVIPNYEDVFTRAVNSNIYKMMSRFGNYFKGTLNFEKIISMRGNGFPLIKFEDKASGALMLADHTPGLEKPFEMVMHFPAKFSKKKAHNKNVGSYSYVNSRTGKTEKILSVNKYSRSQAEMFYTFRNCIYDLF